MKGDYIFLDNGIYDDEGDYLARIGRVVEYHKLKRGKVGYPKMIITAIDIIN
jgi:hypothetical protein